MDKVYYIIFASLVIISVGLLAHDFYTNNYGNSLSRFEHSNESAEVKRVIDGDTVVLEDGERVRLLGFDSHETYERCFEEDTEMLEALLDGGSEVELVRQGEDRDVYGRILRHIFVGDENINKKMVEKGHGVVVINDGDSFMEDFYEAEMDAWKNSRGCHWSDYEVKDVCGVENYSEEYKVVEGEVSGTHDFGDGVFVNFGEKFPDHCFTAVFWEKQVFKNLNISKGSSVKLHGEIDIYEGSPQIIVDRWSQVKLLE